MKPTKFIFAILTIVLLVAAGCSAPADVAPSKEVELDSIKFGMSLPMTGEAASWGANGIAGAQLAVNEINAEGGVNGQQIELIVEDDKCTPTAVSGIKKLIDLDGVDAILGPVCSAAAGPALPQIQEAGVPTIIIASAPDLTATGDYIFRVYPSDAAQGEFAAEYVSNDLGLKTAAIIYTNNPWGEGLRNVFVEKFEELGGEVLFDTSILQTDTDLRTSIVKAQESGADLLYFPVYPTNAIAGLKVAQELGLEIPIFGGDVFTAEEVLKSGYAQGVLFTQGKENTPDDFKTKINALPGSENLQINIAATHFYDAVYVMAEAIKQAGLDKAAIRDALAETYAEGVSSPVIEFNDQGDLKSAQFQVRQVQNEEGVVIKE